MRKSAKTAIIIAVAILAAAGIFFIFKRHRSNNPKPTVGVMEIKHCAASDLSIDSSWTDPGNLTGIIHFKNESSKSCTLEGYPDVAIEDATGKKFDTDAYHLPKEAKSMIINPGQSAAAGFMWGNWCGDRPRGSMIVLVRLSDNGGQLSAQVLNPDGSQSFDVPQCSNSSGRSVISVGPFTTGDEPLFND